MESQASSETRSRPRNPFPAVDVVIFLPDRGVLLVRRKNPPLGWALPGGFIDYGESAEQAAVRETLEETGLRVQLTGLVGVYSDPARDPRFHTLSIVYTAGVEEGPVRIPETMRPRPVFFPFTPCRTMWLSITGKLLQTLSNRKDGAYDYTTP